MFYQPKLLKIRKHTKNRFPTPPKPVSKNHKTKHYALMQSTHPFLVMERTTFGDPIVVIGPKKVNTKHALLMRKVFNVVWNESRVQHLAGPPSEIKNSQVLYINHLDLDASLTAHSQQYRHYGYITGYSDGCAACRLKAHEHLCMVAKLPASPLRYSLFLSVISFNFSGYIYHLISLVQMVIDGFPYLHISWQTLTQCNNNNR